MGNVNQDEYNSQAVRAAAKKLRSCAQTLESGTKSKLRTLSGELPEYLEGDAAQSLRERMGELGTDVSAVVGGMNGLARALEHYAEELERTAERLRKLMAEG